MDFIFILRVLKHLPTISSAPAIDCPCLTEKDFPVLYSPHVLSSHPVASLPATSSSDRQFQKVFVPEQVTTRLYDWLKASGDEMGTIERLPFVWNHTDGVSVDACYAPIVLNAG